MANSTGSGSPSLDTINSIFGTSLEFPKCFRKPGTASLFEAKTGLGHLGTRGGALEANPGPLSPITIDSLGINNHKGMVNISGSLTVTGTSLFLGGVKGNTAFWTLETGSYTITSGGGINLTSAETATLTGLDLSLNSVFNLDIDGGFVTINGRNWDAAAAFWDSKKPFDIAHPTKPNHRLRYVCVESPTADVYVRGKLNNSNIIELPEYWKNLIDIETITVILTPYEHYQELFVEKIESETKIIVKNNSASKIKCDYVVYGERKDTSKNIPEYEGTTPNDYPGDNREYAMNGVSNLYVRQ